MEIYGSVSFQSSVSTYGSVTFQSSVKLFMEIYGSVSEAGEFGLGLVWICSNHDFIFFFCLKSSILWCSTLCIKLNYFIAGSKFAFSFSNLDILASLKKVNNVKLLVIFFCVKNFENKHKILMGRLKTM